MVDEVIIMSTSHPSLDAGNGDDIPEGLSAQEYARIMARSVASIEYSIGSLMSEVGKLTERVGAFEDETHQSFEQLGVIRKRIKKVEQKASDLADDLEDTKTRELRAFKRKYNWWKNAALTGVGTIVVGVIVLLIGHYVFGVG